jgi:NADH-quinone oxidoreductase subunit E
LRGQEEVQVKEREKVARATSNGKIDQIIEKHRGDASALIQVLLEIQSEHHWLPKEALGKVSDELEVPLSQIQHVATFYKAFSLVPRGRHEIQVCMGTACHIRGAPRILDMVENFLGIHPGETDLDLKFSLETVNCLGCCAMGPVMVVDRKYHGKAAPANVENILKRYD